MTAHAYPLQWPEGWPRTPAGGREDSRYRFKSTSRQQRRGRRRIQFERGATHCLDS